MEKIKGKPKKKEEKEVIPSEKEVTNLFDKILDGADYKETRKLTDELGVYCWEIEVMQESGEIVEYAYMRKGNYKKRGLPGGLSAVTAIHVTYFNKLGRPISGHSVAELVDGCWVDRKINS